MRSSMWFPDANLSSPANRADPRSYRVDFSAFRNELGFEAAWSIPDGAAELYQRIHRRRADADDFAKRFTRLPHLESLRANGT